MITLLIISAIAVLLGLLYYMFPLAEVVGTSMVPTYNHGDIVLCQRFKIFQRLELGKVYVFVSPCESLKLAVKRLNKISSKGNCYFLGDNSSNSYDSRNYGYVSQKSIIAKVLWKIKKAKILEEVHISDNIK